MTEYPAEWVRTSDKRFGRRVRETREHLSMNQQELVDALRQRHDLNWHQSTVTKLESGSRPTRLSEALAVADVLGVELASLIDRPEGGDEAQRQRTIEFHARLSQIAEIKRDFERDMSKRERQIQGFLDQGKW